MGLNDIGMDSSYEQRKPSWLQRITRTHDCWQHRVPFLNSQVVSSLELFWCNPNFGAGNSLQQTSVPFRSCEAITWNVVVFFSFINILLCSKAFHQLQPTMQKNPTKTQHIFGYSSDSLFLDILFNCMSFSRCEAHSMGNNKEFVN